ncbi:serum response factor homolog A-like [Meleagris gallopavo]|uniref:serum response factor homolog A-like n=1 Tax=Meleagris gallopavo TaxID=9103 RepID=UPI000549CBB4|nr:serum response factor homolog A-like [Meleagris gallopavo]XP_031410677.1 serum response factor homolog A-like [Meleagris gallopavo]
MDLNKAKIEHKRHQEEERQLKRQQQQEADAVRRQLHRNNQRQRLYQRMLQGLEKQLEHKNRALQHMALLQAAQSERSKKESFLAEEENRKLNQRLQFLHTQRLQRENLLAELNERSFEQEKGRLLREISRKYCTVFPAVAPSGVFIFLSCISSIIVSFGETYVKTIISLTCIKIKDRNLICICDGSSLPAYKELS